MSDYVVSLQNVNINDANRVGIKNASLGEMKQNLPDLGIRVPDGFATTAFAYHDFMAQDGLGERIQAKLGALDVDNIALLKETSAEICTWIKEMPFQPELEKALDDAYAALEVEFDTDTTWAVRYSAIAEGLPDAPYTGQQETYLNVSGLDNIKSRIREVFASLFNDRAISYRVHQGLEHHQVVLSAGVQKMVRSDIGAAGVAFSLDTESGFRDVVFITSSYGLGEMVVQGAVNPDEFFVHKPTLGAGRPAILRRNVGDKSLQMVYNPDGGYSVKTIDVEEEKQHLFSITDAEVEELARQVVIIEKHYDHPMDIEWAKDGSDGRIYIVQARPETVRSQVGHLIERYELKQRSVVLTSGRAVGSRIAAGPVRIISDITEHERVNVGDILVTDMIDPDWAPILKRVAALVINRGGRTCHAAVVARELGIPAVLGCSNATTVLTDDSLVTVSCCESDIGFVYEGKLDFEHNKIELNNMPPLSTKIMMNVGNPDRAFSFCSTPNAGVGLARMEFVINNMIGIHPQALLEFGELPKELRDEVAPMIAAYENPQEFFIQKIVEGISTIAAAFSPHPVIVRLSDFKSNEYSNLIGGTRYEPEEENPMMGFRGASRYLSASFKKCFEMECEALKRVRNDMGLTNVEIMIPFIRTLGEASRITEALAANGLKRSENGLRLIMMCEVPSNALMAEEFLEYFDGFSIGSNDLTQFTLALDRDSGLVANISDQRDPAVRKLLRMAIEACHAHGKYVGICGEGPANHPELANWLVNMKISSISLNPDAAIDTWLFLAEKKTR